MVYKEGSIMKRFDSMTIARHCEERSDVAIQRERAECEVSAGHVGTFSASRARKANKPQLFSGLPRSRGSLAMTPTVKRVSYGSVGSRSAFTMAEILLSLTIIGVVAAITLPSLTGNINERVWNTQRKALHARFSQAIALMPQIKGYGTFTKESGTSGTASYKPAVDTAAETFITEGLSKVMKINNICDADHLADCGIVTSYTDMAGSQKTMPTKLQELNSTFGTAYNNTKAVAFETQNGESIAVYYNPKCISDDEGDIVAGTEVYDYAQQVMCANFIYDLNGNKGPNFVGKDIGFMSAIHPTETVIVAPMPLATNTGSTSQPDAGKKCTAQDPNSRVPNKEELSSMFYNTELIGIGIGLFYYWSSTAELDKAWFQSFHTGQRILRAKGGGLQIRCIKR